MNSTSTSEAIQSLQGQIQELKQLIQDQGTLGLTQGRRFIYVQNTKHSLWSYIANDEPVGAVALTGYIIDLYRKEDDIPKLHIVMRTREAEFVLCSGFETHFSRDVMAAIAQLTPAQARRPLKIIPCLKDIKQADPGNQTRNSSPKKPVYANVLLDDKTLYTHQLKQQLSAAELFVNAQQVLRRATPSPDPVLKSTQETSKKSHQPLHSPPCPSQTSSKKPISKEPASKEPISKDKIQKTQSIDWRSFCCEYGVLPGALKALAQELGLPIGKLNPQQAATLYHHAYSRFVRGSVAS